MPQTRHILVINLTNPGQPRFHYCRKTRVCDFCLEMLHNVIKKG